MVYIIGIIIGLFVYAVFFSGGRIWNNSIPKKSVPKKDIRTDYFENAQGLHEARELPSRDTEMILGITCLIPTGVTPEQGDFIVCKPRDYYNSWLVKREYFLRGFRQLSEDEALGIEANIEEYLM